MSFIKLISRKSKTHQPAPAEPQDEKPTANKQIDDHVFMKPVDPKPLSESRSQVVSETKQNAEKAVRFLLFNYLN